MPDLGTFNQYLICNKGDLWQNYEGSVANPSAVVPDFSVSTPVLSLYVTSSRVSGHEVPDEVKFFIDDVLIGSITCNLANYVKTANTAASIAGIFELLDPTENNGCYGLKIKKNIVSLTNGESGLFRAEFIISDGSSSTTLQASCPFNISEVIGNSAIVVIEAGDNYNFQITKSNSSVILAAKYYKGLTEVSTGISYKWYRQKYGANQGSSLANWELIASETGNTLTVSEADVDTSQRFMVRVCDQSGTTVLGQDTQMVYDAADLFEIVMNRNPEDGQVHAQGDNVTVTCDVYRRDKTVKETLTNPVWLFIGNTPAGTPVLQQKSASNVCTVSYDDIMAAGGQLELNTTVEF